jgi:transglutaminase-like putative cysteine protease
MSEYISAKLKDKITENYQRNMARYGDKQKEVDRFIEQLQDEDERIGMQYTYAYMPVGDIVTYVPKELYPFVKYAFHARRTIEYTRQIPEEIFLAYVMFYRINNENLDRHRERFYEELFPLTRDMDMKQAAIHVNYWCYEKATYIPTDIRTAAPLTMIKRAEGRCGEESVLAVAGLRSIGIPARQCYVPRWAHCDDNHAWVELWADGQWYYLGACEPEPVLNKGWFTAAASKSMLVAARTFSDLITEPGAKQLSPILEVVNSTFTYGECRRIEVTVTEQGVPVKDMEVQFELVNAGELYPLDTGRTDGQGKAEFYTGLGDIYVHVQDKNRVMYYKMDVRREEQITLRMEDALITRGFTGVHREVFDMVPPKERVHSARKIDDMIDRIHKQRLTECEKIRAGYKDSFTASEEKGGKQWYLMLARGNQEQLNRFFELTGYSLEDKLQLLSTLMEKDFADITSEVLEECLEVSLEFQKQYPEDIYRDYVLAPRVANEMLRRDRKWIQQYFAGKGTDHPKKLWKYIKEHVKLVDELGCDTILCSAIGTLQNGVCGKHSFAIVYISVCRALGMAARLNSVTHEPEYYEALAEGGASFVPLKAEDEPVTKYAVSIDNASDRRLKYGEHITVGKFREGRYETLSYPEDLLEDHWNIEVEEGSYRILSCFRQMDGTVSANAYYYNVPEVTQITVELREDNTRNIMKNVSLPDAAVETEQHVRAALRGICGESSAMLIFAEPGKEPTEHLLQELLACRQDIEKAQHKVIILLSSWEEATNPTLQRVCRELNPVSLYVCEDREYLARLHQEMNVGDERLPFALAVAQGFLGRYAFANYNIGTAKTLLSILKLDGGR